VHVHVLQHVPFEDLGSIAGWLAQRDAAVTYTRFYESATLPDPSAVDLVIALGGPMSVNDERDLPWLVAEKTFVHACVAAGKPVLGICLGAQLIASAQGALVYPGPCKEIGWFPIAGVPVPAGAFAFPATTTVFHWHGETFDLPDGAVPLARSAGCEHQAFQLGSRVIGLQFHLDTTADAADAIIGHCRDELVDGTYIQSEAAMRGVPPSTYAAINALMAEVLSYLTRDVPG
jgi:GMP synthase-like glutamine amidotransferase